MIIKLEMFSNSNSNEYKSYRELNKSLEWTFVKENCDIFRRTIDNNE